MIDSNVVLDWLLFRDGSTLALDRAMRAGALVWIASAAMLAEYRRVFKPELAAVWHTAPNAFESSWAGHGRSIAAEPPPCGLRCSDPDDQVFIDLAVACRAGWLLTRDRALLKLARRARHRGLAVLRPADWRPPNDALDQRGAAITSAAAP